MAMCTAMAATSIDGALRAVVRAIRDMKLYLNDFFMGCFHCAGLRYPWYAQRPADACLN